MPNTLSSTGLVTNTQAEWITYFSNAYKSIYGSDINLDQDSPDGQMMMIYIQALLDMTDLLTQIYNQFDPDYAIGNVLDQRVAINGIQRQAGTHTVTNITLVVTKALNLYGADQSVYSAYTVADNQGNQWQLLTSVVIGAAGTYVYAFEAVEPGAICQCLILSQLQSLLFWELIVSTIRQHTPHLESTKSPTLNLESEDRSQCHCHRKVI